MSWQLFPSTMYWQLSAKVRTIWREYTKSCRRVVNESNRPTKIIRSIVCIPAYAYAGRMRVVNVPVRNRRTAGVQASPKLSVMVDYVEREKAVTPPCARYGRQNRKAC